jgi:hypothetical protein
MSPSKQIQIADAETADSNWKSLYRIGGVAPLIALAFYLTQMLVIVFGEAYPATIEDWFSLFQRSKVLGLLYLNALDVFSIAFLGTMFLALYVALRRGNESYMVIAAFLAFIGVAVFVAPRAEMVSATLSLSDQYAAATTEVHKAQILATGRAMNALGQATPQTIGFLFMAVAGLIISVVMLRSRVFNKATAYLGILAGVVTSADHICIVIAPSIAGILMPVDGLLWLVWWILVSRGLFQLGKRTSKAAAD